MDGCLCYKDEHIDTFTFDICKESIEWVNVCLRLYQLHSKWYLMNRKLWINSNHSNYLFHKLYTNQSYENTLTHTYHHFGKLKWFMMTYKRTRALHPWVFICFCLQNNNKKNTQLTYTSNSMWFVFTRFICTRLCKPIIPCFIITKQSILMQAINVPFTLYSIEHSSILRYSIWITIISQKQIARLGTHMHRHTHSIICVIKPLMNFLVLFRFGRVFTFDSFVHSINK